MENLKKKINITVEKTDTGYSAYTEDMSVFTTGKDIRELYTNLIEALNLAYEELGYEVTTEQKTLKLNISDVRSSYSSELEALQKELKEAEIKYVFGKGIHEQNRANLDMMTILNKIRKLKGID